MEECSVVLQSSAGLSFCCFLFVFFKSASMQAHIVTVWRNEATCELFSQGDFMVRLIYSTAFHTILLVPPDPPSVFLNDHCFISSSPFLVLSL